MVEKGRNDGAPRGEGDPPPPEGGLGLQFLAAAAALGIFLTLIALAAYFVMRK